MSSATARYRKRMKEKDPMRYEEFMEVQRQRARQKRAEKKLRWESEPNDPWIIAEKEREREMARERTRRFKASKEETKRHTKTSALADKPLNKPKTDAENALNEEQRAIVAAKKREQRARMSYEMRATVRKRNRERMREKRAVERVKHARLQIVLAASKRLKKKSVASEN